MLKRVLFNLEIDEKKRIDFINRINGIGLDCIKYNDIMEIVNNNDSIIVTDRERDIAELRCTYNDDIIDMPVIAYDNIEMEGQDLFRADLLVEELDSLDFRLLYNTYLRFYKEAIIIGETNRLIIREMKLGDLDELYKLYEPASITEFLEPLYADREEEEEYLKAYIDNMYSFYGYGMWAIVDKISGKLIGRAGLNNREVDGEIQIELGYMIGASYQRQGYAYEACLSILEFAKIQLECEVVNCFVDKENISSLALIKKLGFEYVYETHIEDKMLSLYRWTYKHTEVII